MNCRKYFDAPIFESSKSRHIVRFQSEFEENLMKSFDNNSEVIDYFQPLMEIAVGGQNEDSHFICIDFWLESKNGKTILIHVPTEEPSQANDDDFKQARIFCRQNNFEFLVLRSAEHRQVSPKETVQLKFF